LGGRILTVPLLFFSLIALVGLFYLAQRFVFGLGAVTNLNQGYPWGIWVVYDVVVGTGFACGGYALAVMVYAANKGQYHPLVRPALLASLFGYTLGGFSAFFDMGRWWQGYNIFLPWNMNLNSVMLEVGLCVTAYILVLWIEFSPAALEYLKRPDWAKRINRFMFVFIAIGLLLPTMHQSSLGSLLIASGHKVSPLWQTQLLPLLFLISALAMGFAIVLWEGTLSAWGFMQKSERHLLAPLGRMITWLLGGYLLLRVVDLTVRGAWGPAFAGDLAGNFFWLEQALFALPLWILLSPAKRGRSDWLFAGGLSMLLAGALYRFNAFLIGFDPGPGFHYFPSAPEIMVSLGMIAIEVVAFLIIVKKLPVMHGAAAQVKAGV
jgi:Ni/Fe-hydrogenase subunit HybB-like protein